MKPTDQGNDTPPPRRSWWRRIRRWIFLYVLIPYLSLALLIVVFQRRLIYHPIAVETLNVETLGLDPQTTHNVHLRTPDGQTIRGWLLTPEPESPQTQRPLVIYFPGNASNRHDRIYDLREVASCGFDVLIFDYRGFGDSTGSPTEQSLTADARQVWDFACGELNYPSSHIVVFGESLGGGVAFSMWSDDNPAPPQPAAVIVTSTFQSISKTAEYHYPMFPFRFLLSDRWNSLGRIGNVKSPIIIFHGDNDQIVPIEQGRVLAKNSPQADFIEIQGAGHNDIPMHHLSTEFKRIRNKLLDRPEFDAKENGFSEE